MSGNGLNSRAVWLNICYMVIILRYSKIQFAKAFPKTGRASVRFSFVIHIFVKIKDQNNKLTKEVTPLLKKDFRNVGAM